MQAHDSKVNILLVDDHPEGLTALEAVLQRPQYNLIKAHSGEEALGKILAYEFAVILMDVQMPGMDGFETVSLIKQREKSRDIPVIFITAINKETAYIHKGYESGAVDYIFKPFEPIVLSAKVGVLVDLYTKTRLLREQNERLHQSEVRERARQLATLQLESFNRYRHLADAIPQIIWKFHPSGTLEYCNRLWCEYSGLTLEQSSGMGWQSVVHPDDLPELLVKCDEARSHGLTLETELRLLRQSDNSYRWHMFRGVPEFQMTGEVGSWIVTNTDIEDRKIIERDLIRAKEESLAASEAKSAFLANMSHEIRTPLGIVLGFAELLADPTMPIEERRNCLGTVKKNGELLSRLIGDVLDLSKVEAGHLQIETTQVSLPDFLGMAMQSFRHQASDKGILLSMKLDTPIPVTIESDPMRLRQILFNIVGNAIKFTHAGKVEVNVRLEGELLRITVSDEGVGITPAQAMKLFQPFIQADNSTTRKFGGTGLGLSLARKLARKMGGDVVLGESAPNRGSTFEITVGTGPLDGVRLIEHFNGEKPAVVATAKAGPRLEGVRVLVVEDAPENQMLLQHFLAIAGATVKVADNGQEGVQKALAEEFDVVLMDIQMPVLDGYQATRQLRSRAYNKPILALTAHALKEERDRCLAAGCNDHLTKPLNREELLSRIAHFSQPQVTTSALAPGREPVRTESQFH